MSESPVRIEDLEEAGVNRGFSGRLLSFWLKYRVEIILFLFFFGVAVFLTWPLLIKFNTSIYGFPGDNLGGIWSFWWTKHASSLGGSQSFSTLLGAPFGTKLAPVGIEFVNSLVSRFLLLFAGEIFVSNLMTLLGFWLSGITMYYLVRYLAKDKLAGGLCGLAFMVVTYHSYQAMSIPVLGYTEFMPLFVLALVKAVEKRTWKWTIIACLAWLLCLGTNLHFGFFMLMFTPFFLIGRYLYIKYDQYRGRRASQEARSMTPALDRQVLAMFLLAILVVIVVFSLVFFAQQNTTVAKWPTGASPGVIRAQFNQDWGAAQPYDYFVPSNFNPVIGKLLPQRMSYQDTIYIGWSMLILAFAGLVLVFIKYRKRRKVPESEKGSGFGAVEAPVSTVSPWKPYMVGFLLAAIAAFLFTMPSTLQVGPLRIPMPSVLFHYVPFFRWYIRLAIVTILCVIVLAGYGLKAIRLTLTAKRGKRTSPWVYVIAVVAAVLVVMEMLIVPPFKSYDFSHTPELYRYLRVEPKANYALYPAYEYGYFNTGEYMFYQRYSRQPMLNGASDGSDGEALRRTIYNPYDPGVPSILARFKIGQVIFYDTMFSKYEGRDSEQALVAKLPRGLREKTSFRDKVDPLFGNAHVFTVTAPPADVVPIFQGDISVPHIDEGLKTVRLIGSSGTIRLVNYAGQPVKVDLDVPLTSYGMTRSVYASVGGKEVAVLTLKDKETGELEIKGLRVPKNGLLIDLGVTGALAPLKDSDEQLLFGVGSLTASMGSLSVEIVP